MTKLTLPGAPVVVELRALIDAARTRAATAVNAELTLLYWQVGRRLAREVLRGDRAAYGEEVIKTVSDGLTESYGKGWGPRSFGIASGLQRLFPMSRFYTRCVWN